MTTLKRRSIEEMSRGFNPGYVSVEADLLVIQLLARLRAVHAVPEEPVAALR